MKKMMAQMNRGGLFGGLGKSMMGGLAGGLGGMLGGGGMGASAECFREWIGHDNDDESNGSKSRSASKRRRDTKRNGKSSYEW